MEFSPNNQIVLLCLKGMMSEEKNNPGEAANFFLEAWKNATNDFEKFLSSFYVARIQQDISDKIKWKETTIELAHRLNDNTVKAAFPLLYSELAELYKISGDEENAGRNAQLAISSKTQPDDKGPFYHGTRASLQTGELLVAGKVSNYQSDLLMNHIYFTANVSGAGLAAALANGEGAEHVYIVEPTGEFEDDPNVTNKKFPGNPTRSYRSTAPLKITGEITDWVRTSPEEISKWKERLAANKGEIIN